MDLKLKIADFAGLVMMACGSHPGRDAFSGEHGIIVASGDSQTSIWIFWIGLVVLALSHLARLIWDHAWPVLRERLNDTNHSAR